MSLDKQARIKITASAELGELQNLNRQIESMADGFAKAVSAGSLLNKAINGLWSSVKEAYEATGQYSKAIQIYTGDIAGARAATKGMVTDLDLMLTQNKMATLGIKMTNAEYNHLFADVKKLAGAMGVDMKFALESTATMLARQSTSVADNIGVVIKAEEAYEKFAAAIGKSVNQLSAEERAQAFRKEALEQLRNKANSLAETTETLTEKVSSLGVAWKNTLTSALDYFNRFGMPKTPTERVVPGGVRGMPGGVGFGIEAAAYLGLMANSAAGAGGYRTWRSGYRGEDLAAEGFGEQELPPPDLMGPSEYGSSRTGMSGYGMGLGYGKLAEGGWRGTKRSKRRGGASSKSNSIFGVREWVYDQLARFDEEEFELAKRRKEKLEALIRQQRQGDVEAEGESQRLRLGEEFKSFARRSGAEKKMRDMEGTAGARIAGADAAAEAMRGAEAFATYSAMVAKTNGELQSLATTGINQAFTGMMSLADAAISGEENVGKMAINMLKSTAMGLSQQLFAMGVAASFEAAALTAGVYTAPFAAAASAKASVYFAGAAALGGMGLGLSALGAAAGGGAKPASTGGRAASGGGDFRPSFGSRQSSKDLPPIIVRVTFDRSDPAAEQFARRQVRAQLLRAGGYGAD